MLIGVEDNQVVKAIATKKGNLHSPLEQVQKDTVFVIKVDQFITFNFLLGG